MQYNNLSQQYLDTLLKDVIPFWQKYSIDTECGGYYSCLDRDGRVYDTDKFIWLQTRQVWTFSMLYNRLENNSNWLKVAKHGADFLQKYGMDDEGNWYFSLDRQGRPLVQPYNIFSDCFAAIAFSEYALATGDENSRQIALCTYQNILKRKDNPKGKYSKNISKTRPLISLSLPMILINLSDEMRWMLDKQQIEARTDLYISEVLNLLLDKDKDILCEYAFPDGSHPDCFEGRLVIPGHGIEAMWFIMEFADLTNQLELVNKAVDIVLSTLDFGWDKKYGGIFYFLDVHNKPPLQLEWDQKLWWVHVESLIALAKGFCLTKRQECWQWFEKIHDFTWQHFPDSKYGEWFGYLNRGGEKLLKLKGGKWKGCFHLPRGLYLLHKELRKISILFEGTEK